MANQLIKYSIGIVYRISNYVQEQYSDVMDGNKDIEKMLMMTIKLRSIIESKVDKIVQVGGNKREQNTAIQVQTL